MISPSPDDQIIAEFEKLRRERDSITDPRERGRWNHRKGAYYHELWTAYKRITARRREEREKEARKERAREREKERLSKLPDVTVHPPREWVLDGSFALLSVTAQRVLYPLYQCLDPTGLSTRISHATIARLVGISERSVSRAVRELKLAGWIMVATKRVDGTNISVNWYRPPDGPVRMPLEDKGEEEDVE